MFAFPDSLSVICWCLFENLLDAVKQIIKQEAVPSRASELSDLLLPYYSTEVFLTNKREISSFVLRTVKQVSSSNIAFY